MAREIPVRAAWQGEPVVMRTAGGQRFVLVDVRKCVCENCRYGERVETTWTSAAGDVNRVAWCRSCFNADCERSELDDGMRVYWGSVAERLKSKPELPAYDGARPAIEDLERRGLV